MSFIRPGLLLALLLFLTVSSPGDQTSQAILTNKDVIEMLQAGLTPEIVIAKIKSSSCDFDTSPDVLKQLKVARVPDAVILAMVQAPAIQTTAPSKTGAVGYVKCGVNQTKVYLLKAPPVNLMPTAGMECGDTLALLDEQDGYYKARTKDGAEGYISHVFVSDRGGLALPENTTQLPGSVATAAPAATTTQAEGAAPSTSGPVGYAKCGVNGTEVYLLNSPTGSVVTATVKCGDSLTLLGEQSGYYKAHAKAGAEGYISHYFVSDSSGILLPEAPTQSTSSVTTAAQPSSFSTGNALPRNVLRAVAWRAVPWVTTTYYQQPGYANTDCTGGGSWIGNTWQGNASCTTQYTPAQSVPINWTHYTVYNLVETSDASMVVACTRNWAFSKCSYLVPGNVFSYEYKGGKLSVEGKKGGKDKEQRLEYDVVSSQPKAVR